MAEYLSPGVYVEEIDSGPKPIEGVSTSTAGAVGVTMRGPTDGKPLLVTSFADFQRKFGSFVADPDSATANRWLGNHVEGGCWWTFPLAVRGFFDNGGQRLFVKRVFTGGGLPASAQTAQNTAVASNADLYRGLVAEIESDASADANPAAFVVHHLFGIFNGVAVRLVNGESGQQIGGAFSVASYDAQTRRVVLNNPLPANTDVRASRSDLLVVAAPAAAGAGATPLNVRAGALGKWGDSLRVRTRPMAGATLALLADPVNGGAAARALVQGPLVPGANPGDPWTVPVRPAAGGAPPSLTGFANNDHVLVLGHELVITGVDLANNRFQIPAQPAGTVWPAGTPIQRLRPALIPAAGNVTVRVWGATRLYDNAVVELDNGSRKEPFTVTGRAGDVVTLSGAPAGNYYEGHVMRIVEVELTARYQPGGVVETEEVFGNLRLVGAAGDPGYIVTEVNANSNLVELADGGVAQPTAINSMPVAQDGHWLPLQNGNDRLDQLSPDDFVGVDGGSGHRTGIQALEDIDEVSICLVPGIWSRTVHNALIEQCETLKDRFAIVDPRDRLDIQGILTFREVYDTKYAALYYPWLEVRDPVKQADVRLAPSGHMAGIYARVDVDRGVHKAPANEVIRAISQLAEDVNKREQDLLNPKNVNALRAFPGRGNRVWGARCLTSDSAWKYINVRRLFIYVEESIDEGTQWVVFEPNDETTWARVRLSVSRFLNTLWRNGALFGKTAAEAYFVKCDLTTMSADDLDNGRLICVVGIAPVKPAEFVIFRVQQKTLDAQDK